MERLKRFKLISIFAVLFLVAFCGFFVTSLPLKSFALSSGEDEVIVTDKRVAEYFLEDYPNIKYTVEYSINNDKVTIYNPLNCFIWVSATGHESGDKFTRFTGEVITLNISDFYNYNRNYDYEINFAYVCLSEDGSTYEGDDSTEVIINNRANTYVVYFEETASYEVAINYKLYDGTPSVFNVRLPAYFIVDETSIKLPNIDGYKFIGYEDNGPPFFKFVCDGNLVFTAKYEKTSIIDENEIKGTIHFSYLKNLGDTTFAIEQNYVLDTVGKYDSDHHYLVFSDLPFSPDNVLVSDFIGWEYIYSSNDEHYVRALYSSLNFRAYDSKGASYDYNVSLTNFDAYYTNMYYDETTYTKAQVWEFFQSSLPYDITDYDVQSSDELYGYFFFSSIPQRFAVSELITMFSNTTWDGLLMLDAYTVCYLNSWDWVTFGKNSFDKYVSWYKDKTAVDITKHFNFFEDNLTPYVNVCHYYFYADCTTSEMYIGRNGATDYNDDTSRFDKVVNEVKDKIKNVVESGKDILKIIGYVAAAIAGIILIVLIVRLISWVVNGLKKAVRKR